MERIPKPAELLEARAASATLFELLRRWFDVPDVLALDLARIDSADRELADVQYVMAMAMRKLQAFHLLTGPGTVTTTDVVITVVQDLERALQQAPRVRLRREAARTDWDAALVALDSGDLDDEAPDVTARPLHARPLNDSETDRFRAAHRQLRSAAQAVLKASEGRIRRLE